MASWHFLKVLPSKVLFLVSFYCVSAMVFILGLLLLTSLRTAGSLLARGLMWRQFHSVSSCMSRCVNLSISWSLLSEFSMEGSRNTPGGVMHLKFLGKRSRSRKGKWKLPMYNYSLWTGTYPKHRIIILSFQTCCFSDWGAWHKTWLAVDYSLG